MSWLGRALRSLLPDLMYHSGSLADASDGDLVRIFGRIHADEVLTAPITGRECVAWVVHVERYDGYLPIFDSFHAAAIPFWIDDESARSRVEPVAASSHLELAFSLTEARGELSERGRAFLDEHRYQMNRFGVREASLLPRATATVTGRLVVTREPTPAGTYRDGARPARRELQIVGDVRISNR